MDHSLAPLSPLGRLARSAPSAPLAPLTRSAAAPPMPAPRNRFDAVIVGGGPAGSAAAILLARAGWAVALIERQRFPRRKVCGECVAASNLPLLDALGIGPAVEAGAGAELRQVRLLQQNGCVSADLPAADHDHHRFGRALGRETLDTAMLDAARGAGAEVLQPWALQAIGGVAGAWQCEARAVESGAILRLAAPLVIDAHGSWEDLPAGRPRRRLLRSAADLFSFKANFTGAPLPAGAISVLALDGGYGGMVMAQGGVATVACCIRRDRLSELRAASPGLSAGDAVQAWLLRSTGGVRRALDGATRDGAWLASAPLEPGVRLGARDEIFRIGNAAGEAHPILGEGMSMALQSAALLCSHLQHLQHLALDGAAHHARHSAAWQAAVQQRYAAAWRRAFVPRLHLAAAFAHAAMRPRATALLMRLVGAWPALLTHGARWGGKVQAPDAAAAACAWRRPAAAPPPPPPLSPATH